jgi:restriction system protein
MAPRRKKDPDILGIALAAGALVALAIILPPVRSGFQQIAGPAAFPLCLASFLGLVGLLLEHCLQWKSALPTISTSQSDQPPSAKDASPDALVNAKITIEKIHAIDWFQFEKLVEIAYSRTHKVIRRGGAKADGGIDLIIADGTGDTAVQCKHWKSWNVGVRNVRELIGAMTDAGLKKGILVTIKGYSAEAAELAKRHQIELVDEAGIIELLEAADTAQVQAILNDQRKFCPRCDHQMALRTARKGENAGGKFWGCSDYPKCRQTLPFENTVPSFLQVN